MFEGHQGPVTGISCHSAVGTVDFSHLFITSSFDWTVKLWSTKVRRRTPPPHTDTAVLIVYRVFKRCGTVVQLMTEVN